MTTEQPPEQDVMTPEQQERQAKINKALSGKTIASVSVPGINTWTLHFTDGSPVKLWAEVAISTPCGSIPGIFLDEEMGGL